MRLSTFWTLMRDEFGEGYASSLARLHAVHGLDSRTVERALADGVPPRTVWLALCDDMGVPESRRLGLDRSPTTPGQD